MEVCCEQHGESKELLWAATMQEYLVKFTGGTGLKVFKEEISLVIDEQWNSLPQHVGKTKCLKGIKMMIWMKVITLMVVQQ